MEGKKQKSRLQGGERFENCKRSKGTDRVYAGV